jgi:pimeloyl-ACP methyl ester carboxylesterase
MPVLERPNGARIQYDVRGSTGDHPLILLAPGGMNSIAQLWAERPGQPGTPMPWIDPRASLSDQFRVISMDQRNAGGSSGPVEPGDGWHTYTEDQVALLDHLGVSQTHAMGGCIGSSYALALCARAPGRVTAAVLQNPIGLTADNHQLFMAMVDDWASGLRARGTEISDATLEEFRERMFGGDFVFSVDREFVRRCPVPLLILAGNDEFHPTAVAEEIAELAPDSELVHEWAGPQRHAETADRIRSFLAQHTPGV